MELKNKKIVVIIAHPDDETLGCGGLLSKASRLGADCKVILALKRANERNPNSWTDEINHFKLACNQLNVTPVISNDIILDDTSQFNVQKISNSIQEYISWSDIVLCHWKGDIHHAHRSIALAVELSTRPFRSPKTVLCFEIATSTDQGFENTFHPNCYVALDEQDMSNKKLAMQKYTSEIFPGRTPNDLEYQMRYRGSQSGSEFAEAYVIIRHFI